MAVCESKGIFSSFYKSLSFRETMSQSDMVSKSKIDGCSGGKSLSLIEWIRISRSRSLILLFKSGYRSLKSLTSEAPSL